LSYRELDERSDAIARGLRDRGVGKGERVAVSLGNSWEFAVVTYSLFKLGAILVCVIYSGGAGENISEEEREPKEEGRRSGEPLRANWK
jgi:acyl-CoA synthetase (AMP-forming)/AMP-acid ligase II